MYTITLSTQECLRGYNSLREKLCLPLKMRLYFSILEAALETGAANRSLAQFQGFSQQFYEAFNRMSKEEKARFLYGNIQRIKRQYDKIQHGVTSQSLQLPQTINVRGQMSDSLVGLTYWTSIRLTFTYQERMLKVESKNKVHNFDLRLYLVRKSKNYKNTLVLEAVSHIVPTESKKLSLSFKAAIFSQLYDYIFRCILDYRNQLLIQLQQDKGFGQEASSLELTTVGKNSKSLTFLSSKSLNEYLTFKDKIYKKILSGHLHFEQIYRDKKALITRSSSHPDLYQLESSFQCSPALLKDEFLKQYNAQAFSYLIQSQVLEKFSNKFAALYQKHLFQTSYGSTLIREHIMIEEVSSSAKDGEEVLFLKSIPNVVSKKFIDFLCVKIKANETHFNKSRLIIYGSFAMTGEESKGAISSLLRKIQSKKRPFRFEQNELIILLFLEFSQMLFRHEEAEQLSQLLVGLKLDGRPLPKPDSSVAAHNQPNYPKPAAYEQREDQFWTVQGRVGGFGNEEVVEELSQEYEEDNKKDYRTSIGSCTSMELDPEPKQAPYLKNKYQLEPSSLQKSHNKQVVKDHFIFSEWTRKSRGGLVCKDEAPINEQKKVLKYLVKRMGKNVLESKGLLNISLPVSIFKPESHLESVARNFGFAPIFLENAVSGDPLTKMKMALLFSISVSILSISVCKPFNPILGETHQAWIDGCPVYLEQISHHPPIVSYLLVGRGYKVHGQIGAKASFGFNVLYGYSEEANYVTFDDGTQIEVSFGRMAIKGVVFGEREFNFTDKMYAFDPKNKLFSTLTFGEEKSLFSPSTQPDDFFSGEICEVTPEFVQSFFSNEKATYPSRQNIVRPISEYEGIWNGRVSFDGVEAFNFGTGNPCVMKREQFALPSDSCFREDIRLLQEGNIQSSQQSKEVLEQVQRRDRRLRDKLGKF